MADNGRKQKKSFLLNFSSPFCLKMSNFFKTKITNDAQKHFQKKFYRIFNSFLVL